MVVLVVVVVVVWGMGGDVVYGGLCGVVLCGGTVWCVCVCVCVCVVVVEEVMPSSRANRVAMHASH